MKQPINWKLFLILWIASILSVVAVVPYTLTLQADSLRALPIPLHIILPIQIIQNALIFAVLIYIGLYLARKVSLGIPILEGWLKGKEVKTSLKSILRISITSGILVAILIIGIDYLFSIFIQPTSIPQPSAPLWQRILASFYGGIGEEIIMRLFLMTLLVWISYKIKKEEGKPTNIGVWLAIVITSIIFSVGHLPFAATLTTLTPLLIARIIALNSLGSIVFGWLYWRKGLESAIISHFSADIVLHVAFPLLI